MNTINFMLKLKLNYIINIKTHYLGSNKIHFLLRVDKRNLPFMSFESKFLWRLGACAKIICDQSNSAKRIFAIIQTAQKIHRNKTPTNHMLFQPSFFNTAAILIFQQTTKKNA